MEELVAGEGLVVTREGNRTIISIAPRIVDPPPMVFVQMACGIVWGGNGGAGNPGTAGINGGGWQQPPRPVPLDTTDPKTAKKYTELFL